MQTYMILRRSAWESAEDLEAAAKLAGASGIQDIDAPGGGRRVRFSDPDGFCVDIYQLHIDYVEVIK